MRQRRSLVKYWPSSARSRRDAGHALYVPFPPASTSGNIAHVDATADDELRRRLTDLLSGASSNGGRLGRATQRAVRGLVDRGDFAGALRTMTATLAEATAPVTTHERDEFSKLARELSIDQELGPVLARCPSIPIENDIAATRERDVKLLKIGIGVILIFAGVVWYCQWIGQTRAAIWYGMIAVGIVGLLAWACVSSHRELARLRRAKSGDGLE